MVSLEDGAEPMPAAADGATVKTNVSVRFPPVRWTVSETAIASLPIEGTVAGMHSPSILHRCVVRSAGVIVRPSTIQLRLNTALANQYSVSLAMRTASSPSCVLRNTDA